MKRTMTRRLSLILAVATFITSILGIPVSAATCYHRHYENKLSWSEYTDSNKTQHKCEYHYDRICNDCGAYIKEVISYKWRSHEWIDGKCECGYEYECNHSKYKDYWTKSEYVEYNKTQHKIKHYFNRVCSNCDEVIKEVSNYEWAKHNLQGSNCECGYEKKCNHSSYDSVYQKSKYTGTNTATEHLVIHYYNKICDSCGEKLGTATEQAWGKHKYSPDGVCDCGYRMDSQEEDYEENYEEDFTEETAITSYSVEVDKNSKNVRIIAEGDNRVKKLIATMSGNSYSDMKTSRSNKIDTKLKVPTSDDYLTYNIRIYAYDSADNVIGRVNTTCFAKQNDTVWETISEGTKNGLAMLGGVVVGIVNGGFVQPVMAVDNMLDYAINYGNKAQYEYNKAWRASLAQKLEDFMISALPYDQYYYYNAGIGGGEISYFCVGTVLTVRGIAGAVTKVETVDDGVQLAKVVLDNGDEAVLMASQNADDIVVLTASSIDDMANVADEVTKIPNVGYKSFEALKKALGKAGTQKQWHHIVEQNQIGKSGFSTEQINNLRNVVSIPGGFKGSVHSMITGHYKSTPNFTGGLSVRDWLANQPFSVQFEYGLKELRRYGELVATESGWIFTPFE